MTDVLPGAVAGGQEFKAPSSEVKTPDVKVYQGAEDKMQILNNGLNGEKLAVTFKLRGGDQTAEGAGSVRQLALGVDKQNSHRLVMPEDANKIDASLVGEAVVLQATPDGLINANNMQKMEKGSTFKLGSEMVRIQDYNPETNEVTFYKEDSAPASPETKLPDGVTLEDLAKSGGHQESPELLKDAVTIAKGPGEATPTTSEATPGAPAETPAPNPNEPLAFDNPQTGIKDLQNAPMPQGAGESGLQNPPLAGRPGGLDQAVGPAPELSAMEKLGQAPYGGKLPKPAESGGGIAPWAENINRVQVERLTAPQKATKLQQGNARRALILPIALGGLLATHDMMSSQAPAMPEIKVPEVAGSPSAAAPGPELVTKNLTTHHPKPGDSFEGFAQYEFLKNLKDASGNYVTNFKSIELQGGAPVAPEIVGEKMDLVKAHQAEYEAFARKLESSIRENNADAIEQNAEGKLTLKNPDVKAEESEVLLQQAEDSLKTGTPVAPAV